MTTTALALQTSLPAPCTQSAGSCAGLTPARVCVCEKKPNMLSTTRKLSPLQGLKRPCIGDLLPAHLEAVLLQWGQDESQAR